MDGEISLIDKIRILKLFPILSQLEENLLSRIKFFNLLEDGNRQTGIFVTTDDSVYSIGDNRYGCLGVGKSQEELEFSKLPLNIQGLSGKFIIEIHSGGDFIIARSKNGSLFSWGRNDDGQLGLNSTTTEVLTPTEIIFKLKGHKVSQLSCGADHAMALTSGGVLYAWGCNSWGQVGKPNTVPLAPLRLFKGQKIKWISSGTGFSAMVTENGDVFTWGWSKQHNPLGGMDEEEVIRVPTKVLLSKPAWKIACGVENTMILTKEGDLHALWGNSQLVPIEKGRIQDIFVGWNNYDVFYLKENSVYNLSDNSLSKYQEADCKSFQEALALNGISGVGLKFPQKSKWNGIKELLEIMFDCREDTEDVPDLHFVFGNRRIRVHKAILKRFSFYFRNYFDWPQIDDSIGLTEIIALEEEGGIRYEVFRAFLYYIYTDKMELTDVHDLTDLYITAKLLMEPQLEMECLKVLKQLLNGDNAIGVFDKASLLKDKELENVTLQFIMGNLGTLSLQNINDELKSKLGEAMSQSALKNDIV